MALSVYYRCRIFDNFNNRDLGIRKIITLLPENISGDARGWTTTPDVNAPAYPEACNKFGVARFLLIQGPGRTFFHTTDVRTIIETTSSTILFTPPTAKMNDLLWTLTFSELPGRRIEIRLGQTSMNFVFIMEDGTGGSYSKDCYINWQSIWSDYGAAAVFCGFPCIDTTGEYVGIPEYRATVIYQSGATYVEPPVIYQSSIGFSNLSDSSAVWKRFFGDYDPIGYSDDDNPYDDLVDGSTQGGEDTNFDEDSDDVDLDNLPVIDAIGTGFATIFTPSKSQLKALADVFWDSNIFTAMQNLIENITDMFTSLAMVPFNVTAGNTVEVTWFGFAITEIYLTLASQQYYEFDMGSINLDNDSRIFKYDNCLDYSPFSKLGIYLPFIGFQDLDIDECRNATLHLKYRIDILSGACVAIIEVDGKAIYQFSGNCLTQIPITNENMQSLVTDAVNVGIAASTARTAGAASAADIAAVDSNEKLSSAQKEAHKMHAEVTSTHADNHLRSAAANAVMGLKPQYNKTGSVSSSASMLAVKQPYLFLTTSRLAIPKYYEHYAGFPSNITDKLSKFSGFTVVESIRLNNLVATTPEVEEIYKLLKNGVII